MDGREAPAERLLPCGLPAQAGLSRDQAVAARRAFGANEIIPEATSGWRAVARSTASDPMLWFLLVTSALFAGVGQLREAATLGLAVVPLLGMDAWLHRRTLASTAGLASRMASTARTLRDGAWADLPYQELVPGDLVEVGPGMYFPADGVLVTGSGLQADESTLTGEPLPVRKSAIATGSLATQARWAAEHWGTAGTRLLTGTARMRVVWTGPDTRYGQIARTAAEGSHAATPLQQAIGRLVAVLVVVALGLCLVLAAVRLWQGHGWVDAVLSAVTLAVAALPEEFPIVYTFFLGLGVFRLARKKALIRRAVAVENIGRTSCIVSDKTGTLTAGTLTLAHRIASAGFDAASVVQVARLAARQDSDDPLDEALPAETPLSPSMRRLADFPFTEGRRRETALWRDAQGSILACTKGAPETIMGMSQLAPQEVEHWRQQVEMLARSGHKVIACAQRVLVPGQPMLEPVQGFSFAGLLAFEDPVRPGVKGAIRACVDAGIRVIMVTGDHPATAAAIGGEIGLGGGSPTVIALGEDDAPEQAVAAGVDVVARATPLQKLALVKQLQAQGELVAVTGDGVNDVPALRAADIGIAMGERGTRAAREAAPVVLLDDNFRTIVDAVAEGRQLFLNLRLAFTYLLLIHIPLVGGAALVPLLGEPLLFLPIHIVWLELVIHPSAMLGFQDLPARSPLARVEKNRKARFFSTHAWIGIALVGGLACLAVVSGYLHALGIERNAEHARAMAFAILMLCSASFTAVLTGMRTPVSRWIVTGTLLSLVLFVHAPVLNGWLHLSPLHLADWALALSVGILAALGARRVVRQLEGHAAAQ